MLVISDLHGDIRALNALLEHQNGRQLVFVGDYINRGKESLAVLRKVKQLVEDGQAIALLGNHEEVFLQWVDDPAAVTNDLLNIGGGETLQSFLAELPNKRRLQTLPAIHDAIISHFADEIAFVRGLPRYYETAHCVVAHAGISPYETSLSEMDAHDFLWIGDAFIDERHMLPKRVIFGHTPTQHMGAQGDVWVSPCKQKIAIDGGGFLPDGYVHAVEVSEQQLNVYQYSTALRTVTNYERKL